MKTKFFLLLTLITSTTMSFAKCIEEGGSVGVYPGAAQCCPGLLLQPAPEGVYGSAGTCVKELRNIQRPKNEVLRFRQYNCEQTSDYQKVAPEDFKLETVDGSKLQHICLAKTFCVRNGTPPTFPDPTIIYEYEGWAACLPLMNGSCDRDIHECVDDKNLKFSNGYSPKVIDREIKEYLKAKQY